MDETVHENPCSMNEAISWGKRKEEDLTVRIPIRHGESLCQATLESGGEIRSAEKCKTVVSFTAKW